MAGVALSYQKYRAKSTFYDGTVLHTTNSRGCPGQVLCPICSKRKEHDTSLWYQSRAEAMQAQRLDKLLREDKIFAWRRSKSVLLIDAPRASDRVRYRADFDVWESPRGAKEFYSDKPVDPDYRIEVKGGVGGIAYSGKIKILKYRELVRRGEQPPLLVVDKDGREIDVLSRAKRKTENPR